MNIRKRKFASFSWLSQYIVLAVTALIFFALGYEIAAGSVILGLVFLLLYSAFNRISIDGGGMKESTLFGSKKLEWADVRQIGMILHVSKRSFLLGEDLLSSGNGRKELYIADYPTMDVPQFADSGKRIILDYNQDAWRLLKNNPQLLQTFKQGEIAADRFRIPQY